MKQLLTIIAVVAVSGAVAATAAAPKVAATGGGDAVADDVGRVAVHDAAALADSGGLFGGIVYQANPGAYFNVTLGYTSSSNALIGFYNPSLFFRCMGTLRKSTGTKWNYRLTTNRSNPSTLCAKSGVVQLSAPSGGVVKTTFTVTGKRQPEFSVYLYQYI